MTFQTSFPPLSFSSCDDAQFIKTMLAIDVQCIEHWQNVVSKEDSTRLTQEARDRIARDPRLEVADRMLAASGGRNRENEFDIVNYIRLLKRAIVSAVPVARAA